MKSISSHKASRKIRKWILLFTIILFTLFGVFGIIKYKLWYYSIITENISDESFKLVFDTFSITFQYHLLYYFILLFVVVMILYCVAAFILTEALLLSNTVVKRIIFRENLQKFEEIQKKYLSKHYKILQAIIILLFSYIVYTIYFDYSPNSNEVLQNNIITAFIIAAVIISATDLIFKNLRIRKLKLSKEMIRSIFQFNVFSVLAASILLILILNVVFPFFLNSANNYVNYVTSNLSVQYTEFKEALLSLIPEYSNNSTFFVFESEILDRLGNIQFDESISVINISSLILYTIVAIFGIIVLIPQIELWGRKKIIIISIGLIINLFLTKYFIKYLYVSHNAENNIIIFILLYFFFMVVFKVVVDQVEQILAKRLEQNEKNEE